MTDLTCEEFEDLSAELALGVLEGRERAEALDHVAHCDHCRAELLALGVVADRLVELTPSAEPPAGFETRVMARLTPSASDTTATSRASVTPSTIGPSMLGAATARRQARPAVLRGALAAALAVAIGLGGWAIGHQGSAAPATAAAGLHPRVASFVAGRHTVGLVVAYGGSNPWVAMSVVDSGLGNRVVTCELVERDGATPAVGSYALAAGYGYWGAAIPVAPAAISGVRLVDAAGVTVAAATFGSVAT
jgi:hypothetical protein